MEAKATDLKKHVASIAAVLREVCDASDAGPLVTEHEEAGSIVVKVADWHTKVSRYVTTDLGDTECALRLPLASQEERCWIGLHERWEHVAKRKIRFHDCGLRLYIGGKDEEAIQLLRLEWVAPTPTYMGKHAGHPHWHIDRSALMGPEDYLRRLDALTKSDTSPEPEDFNQTTAQVSRRLVYDCSWMQKIHLPAQAGWMDCKWDGRTIPGPHQSEPESVAGLERWWDGALRYFVSEFPKAVFR